MLKQVNKMDILVMAGQIISGVLTNPAHASMAFDQDEKQRQLEEAIAITCDAFKNLKIKIEEEGGGDENEDKINELSAELASFSYANERLTAKQSDLEEEFRNSQKIHARLATEKLELLERIAILEGQLMEAITNA